MVIVILPQRQPDLLGTLDSLGSSRNFNPNPNPISYGLRTNLISKTVDGWLLFYPIHRRSIHQVGFLDHKYTFFK